MAQLASDQEFNEAAAARDAAIQARVSSHRAAESPIVEDLRRAGLEVASVWDLVNTSEPYPTALPVLLMHLERGGYPDQVMAGLARALAVMPAVPMWEKLRALYHRAGGAEEREGLAVALAACATSEKLDALIELLSAASLGDSRIHLLRPILRVGGDRGHAIVESLRSDPVFGREAAALLGPSA